MVCASFNKQDFGHITYVTPELEVWTGFDKKAIVGANIDTMIPKSLASVHTHMMKRYFRTAESRFGFNERILHPTDVNGFVAPSSGLLRVMPSLDRGLEMVILMRPLMEDLYQKNGLAIVDQDGVLIGINKAAWEKFKIPPAACYGNTLGETPLMLNNLFPGLPEGTLENLILNEDLRTEMHPYLMGRRFRANNDLENLQKQGDNNNNKQGDKPDQNRSGELDSEVSMEDNALQVKIRFLGESSFYGGALMWRTYSIVDEVVVHPHQAAASLANLKPPDSYVQQVVKMTSLLEGDRSPISNMGHADLQKEVTWNSSPDEAKKGKTSQEQLKKAKKKVRSIEHSRTLRQNLEQSQGIQDSVDDNLALEVSPEEAQRRMFAKLSRRYSEKEARNVKRLLGQKMVPRLIWVSLLFIVAPMLLVFISSAVAIGQSKAWFLAVHSYLKSVGAVAVYAGFVPYSAGVVMENELILSKQMSAPTTLNWESVLASINSASSTQLKSTHLDFMNLRSQSISSSLGGDLGKSLFRDSVEMKDQGSSQNLTVQSPGLTVALEQYLAALQKVLNRVPTSALQFPVQFVMLNGAGSLRKKLLSSLDTLQTNTVEHLYVWGLVQDFILLFLVVGGLFFTWRRLTLINKVQANVLDSLLGISGERIQGIILNIESFKLQAEDAKNVVIEDKTLLNEENSFEEDLKPKEIHFGKEFNETRKLEQLDFAAGENTPLPSSPPAEKKPMEPLPPREKVPAVTITVSAASIKTEIGPLLLLLSSLLVICLLLLARRLIGLSQSSNASDLYSTQLRLWTLRSIVASLPSQLLSHGTAEFDRSSALILAGRVYSDSSWLERLEVTSTSIGLSEFGSYLVDFHGQQCQHTSAANIGLACTFSYSFPATRFPTMLAQLSSAFTDTLEAVTTTGGSTSSNNSNGRFQKFRDSGIDEYTLRTNGLLQVIESKLFEAVGERLKYWRDLSILFEILVLVASCTLAAFTSFMIVIAYTDKIWQSKSMLNLIPSSVVQETLPILQLLFQSDFMKITH